MNRSKSVQADGLTMVSPGAAAIDIGSPMYMAVVNPDADDHPVRAFGTFTGDLHDMARWFKACGVTSVAMESTGVYWIPAYEVLEEHCFHVILVNARYAKNAPDRKTDVNDATWPQRLHSYGLLRGSFRPKAGVATLRAYLRQHERLIEYFASHIQHMQKALMEMNVQLQHVVSDITGVTGMRIIRAMTDDLSLIANGYLLLTSLKDEFEQAKDTLAAARAPSTRKAYQSDWDRFCAFCDDQSIEALPAPS